MKIMIVDDSSVMRKIVTRTIRQTGFEIEEIVEASDGLDALEKLKSYTSDLILCDVNMPNMNGLEFVEKVNAEQIAPESDIIMVTTEGGIDIVNKAVENGAKGFIIKPFTPEDFVAKVKHLCKRW